MKQADVDAGTVRDEPDSAVLDASAPFGRMLSRVAVLLLLCSVSVLEARENILIIIADDVGVDRVGVYDEHPDPGRTPNIDRLAGRGVLFRNAWSNPRCSPTRSTVLTGRYSFRTGIGTHIRNGLTGLGLALSELTIPEVLPPNYRTAAIGKWHLGSTSQGPTHPQLSGFDHHAGSLFNLKDYYSWDKHVDDVFERSTTYATTQTANDAIAAMKGLGDPWMLWVAFNAPHTPLHAPPPDLPLVRAGRPSERDAGRAYEGHDRGDGHGDWPDSRAGRL